MYTPVFLPQVPLEWTIVGMKMKRRYERVITSRHNRTESYFGYRAGRAFNLMVMVLVILAAILGVAVLYDRLSWPGGPEVDPVPPADQFDLEAAQSETAELGERFNNSIGNSEAVRELADDSRRLVSRYPRFAPAHMLVAQIMMYLESYQDALSYLETSLDLQPNQPEVHILAGGVAVKLNDLGLAERHYIDASSLKPRQIRYLLMLAGVQIKMQKYDEARENLLKAIQVDSSNYKSYGLLADMYTRQNKIDLALGQISKTIELVPADKPVDKLIYIRKQVKLLHRAGRLDEALLILQSLPARDQFTPELMSELAITWNLLGQPEHAARHYEEAMILDPLNATLVVEAARWYTRSGDVKKAGDLLVRARRMDPYAPGLEDVQRMLDDFVVPGR